jgi:hypothetical protein
MNPPSFPQVLEAYFKSVWTVSDYFDLEGKTYGDIMLVASVNITHKHVGPPIVENNWTLSELLNRAVSQLVKKSSFNSVKNVVTLGFRKLSDKSSMEYVPGLEGVEAHFPNTIYNFIKTSSQWEDLLATVGDDAILDLFLSKSVFLQLENGCWLQITGPVVHELFPNVYSMAEVQEVSWRKRQHSEDYHHPSKILCVEKKRMLYHHQRRNGKGLFMFGDDCMCDSILILSMS